MDPTVVSLIGNISSIFSTFILTGLAIYGVRQWRREIKGKAQYELARKIVKAAHRFREELRYVRNPATWTDEYTNRPHKEDEREGEKAIQDEFYARMQRLQTLRESTVQLKELRWEAGVVLSQRVAEYIEQMENMYADLWASMNVYFGKQLAAQSSRYVPSIELDDGDFNRVYGSFEDEYDLQVGETVSALVDELKKYIR